MKRDPRITAYAVGEIAAAEREQFEREMANSVLLQKEADAMRRLGKKLESLPKGTQRFDSATRNKLIADFVAAQKVRNTGRKSLIVMLSAALSVAAALVLFAGLFSTEVLHRGQTGPWANGSYSPSSGGGAIAMVLKPRDDKSYSPSSQRAMVAEARLPSEPEIRRLREELLVTNMAVAAAAPAPVPQHRAVSDAAPLQSALAARSEVATLNCELSEMRTAQATVTEFNNEAYAPVQENEFVSAKDNPLSTFSIDVDTASYSNVRRFLVNEVRPPAGAIRTEELINYFRYNYPQPSGQDPFSVNLEVGRAPWNAERGLVRIGLKGREIPAEKRVPANLVFLIDVSGSMDEPDKLPLLQRSLSALVENLSDEDRVAIVTYAGSSGLVLPPTAGAKKQEILGAIENLMAGGPTHGSEGIRLAYETAREHFDKEGNNRVILCTDGDFNVGTTNESELQRLIEKERESGVFLSVLGFGTGNLKDSTMELLADKGNGNYAYIDSPAEGRKVLVEQMGSTLFTIAKDVKIQVEFNPARVAGYRLIGYENRLLAKEDFNNDKKDAGEIGAGHTVTALYEIIPAGQPLPDSPSVDPLKYQRPQPDSAPTSDELLTVKLRYKEPDGDKSRLLEFPLAVGGTPAFDQASEDFRFAAAVAAFGMKLRGSPETGKITWSEIQQIGRGALGNDPGSYRAELLTLVEKAKAIEEAEKR